MLTSYSVCLTVTHPPLARRGMRHSPGRGIPAAAVQACAGALNSPVCDRGLQLCLQAQLWRRPVPLPDAADPAPQPAPEGRLQWWCGMCFCSSNRPQKYDPGVAENPRGSNFWSLLFGFLLETDRKTTFAWEGPKIGPEQDNFWQWANFFSRNANFNVCKMGEN